MKTSHQDILKVTAVVVIILGGICLYGVTQKTKSNNLQTPLTIPIPVCEPAKDSRLEAAGNWVMKYSTRISDTTAKYIVEEVFKYPHPILILSLVEVESEFTPTAISKAGALGLGQIMYTVHKKDLATLGIYKKRDLFDVDKNIKATSFILQMMLRKGDGDIVKALHFYLGGKDGKYVNRIFSNYVHLSLEIENALLTL